MSRASITVVVLLLLTFGHGIAAQEVDPQIRKLQQQRAKVLRQSILLLRDQYAEGTVTAEQLVKTHVELAAADLELAETGADRLKALTDQRRMLAGLEEAAMARLRAQTATQSEVLTVRAARLKLDIEILREKAKQKAAK